MNKTYNVCDKCHSLNKVDVTKALDLKAVCGNVVFVKVNTEENPQISNQFGIRGIPTLIKFDFSKEVKRVSGALSDSQLKEWSK